MTVQKNVGTCCLWINLRWGVGALCVLQFVRSSYCVVALFMNDIRLQPGGYNQNFIFLTNVIESLGIIFAVVGMVGISNDKPTWIWGYLAFLYIKIGICIFVFLADLWTLSTCRNWDMQDVSTQKNYNNVPLEMVALKGLCRWVWNAYIVGWLVEFSLLVYFQYVTHLYYVRTYHGPTYLLHFPSMSENDHRKLPFFGPNLGDPHHFMEEEVKSDKFLKAKREISQNYGSL